MAYSTDMIRLRRRRRKRFASDLILMAHKGHEALPVSMLHSLAVWSIEAVATLPVMARPTVPRATCRVLCAKLLSSSTLQEAMSL